MEKKKLLKRGICLILFSCLMIFGIIGVKEYKTYAAHGNPSDPGYIEYKGHDTIYLDDSGNFIYQTLDKKKESSLHYTTIGFTFSRIKRGIGNPKTSADPYVGGKNNRETVICPLNDESASYTSYEYTVGGTTWIVSNWVMPYDFVTGCLKQDPVWWAEIEDMMANKEEIYIGCDAILTTCTDSRRPDGSIKHNKHGNLYVGGRPIGKCWDYTNYQELFKTFSSPKNIASIKDHYDKFFKLNGEPDEPDDDTDDDYIFIKKKNKPERQNVNISAVTDTSPDTYTYNTSDKFDLGTAIPTTESFQNTVELDPWYGRFALRHKKFSKTSRFPVSITFKWYTYTPKEVPNEGGKGTHIEYTQVTHNGTYTNVIAYTRKAEYWMVTDASLYQLQSSNVRWDFPADYTYTGEVEQTVPFAITYNGTSWSTGTQMDASSVIYDKDDYYDGDNFVPAKHCGHAVIPELDTTLYSLDLGVVADEAAGKAAADKAAEDEVKRRTEGKDIKTTNDALTLNGVPYLTENTMLYANDESILNQALASNGGYEIEQNAADTVTASTTITIPEKTANDNYPTTLDTIYNAFMFTEGMKGNKPTAEDFCIEGSEEKKNIKEGYTQNEPIKVHSPVFAPISIDDSGSAKQAVSRGSNGSNADGSVNWYPQLNPDGTYTVKFDWDDYFQKKYGTYGAPAGWTQYVEKKQVAFPFVVEYNNVIYEPEQGTGLTEWIDVDPDGTKTEFTIYIPSWAKEGIYGENGTLPIKVKCYANNYVLDTQEAEHYKENDEASAGDPDHKQYYVAVYDYPVQVTGVMYDFTVTGINDEILFGGLEEESTGVWNFVDQKTEHKVGTYNRFNIPSVNSANAENAEFYDRTTFPGNDDTHTWLHTLQNREYRETQHAPITKLKPLAIKNWSETDTLPFTTGKSDVSTMMGELSLGHTIGFQLKTISSMPSEDENANIKIDATYRYVAKDGSIKNPNEIRLYTFDKKNGYVAFSNTNYQEENETSLSDLYFADSYDSDWIKYTAEERGSTETGILSEVVPNAYSTGGINIKQDNMLYSGDTLQLRVNEQKDDKDKVQYGTGADDMYQSLDVLQERRFKSSMQTWYGEYNIPKSTKVMDIAKFLAYCDREGFYDIATRQYGCDRSELTVAQLFDVVNGYGITGNEEWWITDGYLILNFDITAIKNGSEYMSYYKKYDMWSAEAGTWGSPHGERTITITNMDYSTLTTKIYDGDVAVISISEGSDLKNRAKTNVQLID